MHHKFMIIDIDVLTALEGFFNAPNVQVMCCDFYVVYSALDREQQSQAEYLAKNKAISYMELAEDGEVTAWLYEHRTSAVTYNELCVIKCAIDNGFTLLTNDQVLKSKAISLGAKVMETRTLMSQVDDYIVLDEDKNCRFVLRLLRESPKFGRLDDMDFATYENDMEHDYERDFEHRVIL